MNAIEHGLDRRRSRPPAIGYESAADLAKEAIERGLLIRGVARERNVLAESELHRLLDLRRMIEDPAADE